MQESLRVLHIDDESNDRELLTLYLARLTNTLELTGVGSADTALQIIEKRPIDCIISDFQMPGMNGMELLQTLKKKRIDIPFIFLTGQGNEALAAKALREGAADYFSKHEGFALYERLINSIRRNVEARRRASQTENLAKELKEFGQILDESGLEICILDSSCTRLLRANNGAVRNLQYSLEELQRMHPFELFVEKDDPVFQEEISKVRSGAGTKRSLLVHHRRKDGSIYPAEVSIQQIQVADEKVIVSIGNDITERKIIEENVKTSEMRYRILFERESDAVFIFDPETYRIIDANNATCRLYGYSIKELKGMSCLNFSAEKNKSPERAAVIPSGSFSRESIRWHQRKDGTIFPVELQNHRLQIGNEMQTFAIARDVSQRYNSEMQLRAATMELEKRVRELSCLYEITGLLEDEHLGEHELLSEIARLTAGAMQHAGDAEAKITIGQHSVSTGEFGENATRLTAAIRLDGKRIGKLEVCYNAPRPLEDVGPFLEEERRLLNEVGAKIGRIVQRRSLKKTVEGLAQSFDQDIDHQDLQNVGA